MARRRKQKLNRGNVHFKLRGVHANLAQTINNFGHLLDEPDYLQVCQAYNKLDSIIKNWDEEKK